MAHHRRPFAPHAHTGRRKAVTLLAECLVEMRQQIARLPRDMNCDDVEVSLRHLRLIREQQHMLAATCSTIAERAEATNLVSFFDELIAALEERRAS